MKIKFTNWMRLFLLLLGVSASAQTHLPNLRLTSTNGINTVYWPLSAYSDILQTTTSLSPAATWSNLVTGDQIVALDTPAIGGYAAYTTNIVGNDLAFILSATNGQQFFRLSTSSFIPACSFAVFYNGLLEFSQAPVMTINGRVHANGSIYVGTSASLTFNAPVTTASTISSPMADGIGPWTTTNWNTYFNGNPGYITNVSNLGLAALNLTNYHALIDIPPVNENPMSAIGQIRLFNQAQLILIVTNASNGIGNPAVELWIQRSINGALPGMDPTPIVFYYTNVSPGLLSSNLPFLSLTNMFYDQREYKTNLVTQIDVGRFASWAATNANVQGKLPATAGFYPTIFYVADRRSVATNQLSVVRVMNAAQLPANENYGFTLATPNPLYVWGNYNTQIAGSDANASASTTNTAFTVPATLLSDALTILSENWTDLESYQAYFQGIRVATDTTINAAIITGTVPSTGTTANTFSGGIQNLPRLLEDWIDANLWLNTSLIRLWNSTEATNQFRNPFGFNPAPANPYYNPPTRYFNFDQNFLNPAKVPPGIPFLIWTP